MNHSPIQRRAIAKTRKPILPLLGGENSSKRFSRIAPLNRRGSSANTSPIRGNKFSLSPGERAGVRVSVKLLSPRSFQSFPALNSDRRFMERASVKPFKYSAFYTRKPARPEMPLVARRRNDNGPTPLAMPCGPALTHENYETNPKQFVRILFQYNGFAHFWRFLNPQKEPKNPGFPGPDAWISSSAPAMDRGCVRRGAGSAAAPRRFRAGDGLQKLAAPARVRKRRRRWRSGGAVQDANGFAGRIAIARAVMDCGGKRSATPLSCGRWPAKACGSCARAKAPSPLALWRRSPRRERICRAHRHCAGRHGLRREAQRHAAFVRAPILKNRQFTPRGLRQVVARYHWEPLLPRRQRTFYHFAAVNPGQPWSTLKRLGKSQRPAASRPFLRPSPRRFSRVTENAS